MLLKVEHVTKEFDKKDQIKKKGIYDISFQIKRGENYGIIGKSGAGKSTLARVITGMERPNKGSVTFFGKEMQMIFQNPYSSVNPKMNMKQIIEEPWVIRKIGTRKDRECKVQEMLRKVQLEETFTTRYPSELSGGQLQRVVIARSLMLQPDLIVADEMTASLDVMVRQKMIELLLQLKEEFKMSCIFISHDLQLVNHICDRVMVLEQGQCIEEKECKRYGINDISKTT